MFLRQLEVDFRDLKGSDAVEIVPDLQSPERNLLLCVALPGRSIRTLHTREEHNEVDHAGKSEGQSGACPWLIKKFVDKDAEFLFVAADKVMAEAKRQDAIPYDVKDVELGHHGKECSFEAILKKYKLTSDPALMLLGRIVNGADTDNTLYEQPEGAGLEAIAEGFRHLGYPDDHALNAAEWIVYDALYAYCREMVRQGKLNRPEFAGGHFV
jgi:hypothetical protein